MKYIRIRAYISVYRTSLLYFVIEYSFMFVCFFFVADFLIMQHIKPKQDAMSGYID